MKFAYVENQIVVEAVENPAVFNPEYAAKFTPCPDDVLAGWTFDGETWHTAKEPELGIDELKAKKIRDCDLLAKQKRESLTETIAAGEMASWPIKRAEAIAYQQSQNILDAPNLQVEADARQISLELLVQKVLDKANQLSYIEAQLAGVNGRHNDAISSKETIEDVQVYDINAGWPI